MIYLDSAATSLWHPKEAEERMIQALRGCGNAGRGAHDATLDAGRIVFETRMRLAELFHGESGADCIYVQRYGGTEHGNFRTLRAGGSCDHDSLRA